MVNVSQIRTKIENKIFVSLGSSATFSAYTQGSLNKWGDSTPSYASAVDITVVPWNILYGQQEFFEFGELNKGEIDLAVKYDQSVDVNDRLVFSSKTYLVKNVLNFKIKDGILVKAVRLVEEV